MNIHTIRLENFLSHLDTTLTIAGRGMTLITGRTSESAMADSNGVGKSSILPDGLLFGLSGKTLRGKKGSKVVNKYTKKNCLVTITGDVNGVPFIIQRPQDHEEYSQPEVVFNGVTYRGGTSVKEVIDSQILGGVSIDTFIASQIFGKGKNALFFTQLDDATRKEILDEILGFSILGELERTSKEQSVSLSLEIDKITTSIAGEENTINGLLVSFKELTKRYKEAKEASLKQKVNTEQRLSSLREEEKELTSKLTQELSNNLLHVEKVKEALVEVSYQDVQIRILRQQIEEVESRYSNLRKAVLDSPSVSLTCDYCGNPINPQQSILQTQHRISSQEEDLSKTERELSSLRASFFARTDDRQNWGRTSNELNASLKESNTEVERLKHLIVKVQSECASLLKEQDKVLDLTAIEKALDYLNEQIKQHEDTINGLQKELSHLQDDLDLVIDLRTMFGNKGIKSFLFRGAIPRLNQYAKTFSDILTNGEMELRFQTTTELQSGETREKISLEIFIKGDPFSYDECSDGQKRRADIITTLALGELARFRIGFPINLIILDEIFDGLDSTGLEAAVDLLKYLSKEGKSIFVITHDNKLENYFTDILTVEFKNGFSCLDESR